mmetsp:Transcript_121824/g.356015  ORF Transcript_121824/g.356015 Transcript_121824/m.356015 type:complete len:530 (-) Transcript_121824:143-1732(-)
MSRSANRGSTPGKVTAWNTYVASCSLQQPHELPEKGLQASRSPSPAGVAATSPVVSLGRNFLAAGTVPFTHTFEVPQGIAGSKAMVRSSSSSLGSTNAGTGLAAARTLISRRSFGTLLSPECQAAVPVPWPPGPEGTGTSATRAPRPRTRRMRCQPSAADLKDAAAPVEAPAEAALVEAQPELQPEDPAAACPDQPSGLTPASLKHLRRQRDSLATERERLLAEIARLQALAREQQAELEAEARRREELQRQLREAQEPGRREADAEAAAQAIRAPLEEALHSREIEITELRRALEDEQRSSKEARKAAEAAEAAERAGEERLQAELERAAKNVAELEELVEGLREQQLALQKENQRLTQDSDDWQKRAKEAEEARESAVQLHDRYKRDMEKLRPELVTSTIRSKIELHICVPRVALEYPDAPPVIVDMANGLSREHMRKFLQNKVFPQFDPLWMCLDGADRAPDGTNKKAYTARILELLTDRLKEFVDEFRSKMDGSPGMITPEDDSCLKGPRGSGGPGRGGRRPSQS